MSRNEIKVFNNAEFGEVRTAVVNGEPYFVGKDVALALGYSDTADAIKKHVDAEDKGVGEIPTPGGKQKMIIINESGVYSLVFGSKLPDAKKFKRWVTSEVLPSIRKTGGYINNADLLVNTYFDDIPEEQKLLSRDCCRISRASRRK